MKYLQKTTSFLDHFFVDYRYWIKPAAFIIIIQIFFPIIISAQSGTLTFSNSVTANLGTMIYDNRTYSTDISTIEIKVFNAASEAAAASRTSTGSLVFVGPPDLNSTHPAIFSNNATSGTLVFDYENSNRPKYIVLASTNGAEFRFSGVYIVEPDVWIKSPQIRFEGFKNAVSTGSVILTIDQANGEYEKTFDASYFPVNIFGNVDEIRISRGYTDEFTGNLDGFNNFVFSAPVTSYVNVSTNTLGIGATEGSTATFNITSNTSWTVSSNQTWLSASPSSGSNNNTVTLTAQANPSTTTPRSAIITVTGGNTITVTQPAANATLSVSSTSLNIAAAANSSTTFNITSNVTWSVSKDQSWLSVSPTSGSNNGTVTLTAQANPNAATRSATVSVSGAGNPTTIAVTQAAASPTLSVSSNNISIANGENSTGNFQIISNTDWVISSDQSWLSASPSSSNGSAWITLTATSANTNVSKRLATVTVAANGVASQTITVEQDGATTVFLVSVPSLNVGSSAGTTSFNITSNIAWTSLVDQSWVNISPTSNPGTTTVSVNYQENTSTSERTSTITINGENGNKKYVQIIQSGAEKPLTLSVTTLSISELINSNATFDISSNATWSVTSSETWISVSPAGGINNSTVTVTANETNPFGFSRNATVTISSDGLPEKTITVTQVASEPNLSVSSTELNIDYNENSTTSFDITSNAHWTIEKDQDWLTLSDATGTSSKTITLTASENSSSSPRICTVVVKSLGISDKVITVTQAEKQSTNINNNEINKSRIWIAQGNLHIEDVPNNEIIKIYNIVGSTVLTLRAVHSDSNISLKKGVYIIKIGNETHKVIVK